MELLPLHHHRIHGELITYLLIGEVLLLSDFCFVSLDIFLIFQCSFLPSFSISIQTRYENNAGTTDNVSKRMGFGGIRDEFL